MPLYTNEDEAPVSTHSMIKTFRRCPKQTQYKYVRRLKPKLETLPLKRGNWLHSMFEAYYTGEDPWEIHTSLSHKFSELFEEEREDYGDLPGDTKRLFESYLWHYEKDDWDVKEVEFTLETEFPDGGIYRGRIDMMVEDEYGLWLVDHKTHKVLPSHDYRILDSQSALYLWAALRNKIPVQGFIYNYVRTKAPSVPTLIKSGKRVSRWDRLDTDYPTATKALRKYGFMTRKRVVPYAPKLKYLKSLQYEYGAPQNSPFFRRDIVEKSPQMIKRVAMEAYHTHQRMHEYFDELPHPDAVERVPDRSCEYMCAFKALCPTELWGGNTQAILRQFKEGDPLDYYDDKEEKEEGLIHGG